MEQCGLRSDWLVHWRTSEPCKESREAYETGNLLLRPVHSFKSIADIHLRDEDIDDFNRRRPTPVPAKLLKAMTEDEQLAVLGKQLHFNNETQEYIRKHQQELFGAAKTSLKCTQHPGEACAVRWSDSRSDLERALSIGCGGPHCTPYSIAGGRLGYAHPAKEYFHQFIGEHASGVYDISFCEEASNMPPEVYCEPMRAKHEVKRAIFCLTDFGIPCARERSMYAATNQETMIWVGGKDEDCRAHFLQYFQRRVVCGLDSFAGAISQDDVNKTRDGYAKRKFIDSAFGLDTADIVAEYAATNLADGHTKVKDGVKTSSLGRTCVDISQTSKRFRAGACLPTLMKSSVPCLLGTEADGEVLDGDHLFTCAELSSIHGWPTNSKYCPPRYLKALNYNLSEKKLNHQQRLLGDGMAIQCVEAWIAYVLSHSVRRAEVEAMLPRTMSTLQLDFERSAWDGDYRHSASTSAASAGSAFGFLDGAVGEEEDHTPESFGGAGMSTVSSDGVQ
jgi:hypothetical protein